MAYLQIYDNRQKQIKATGLIQKFDSVQAAKDAFDLASELEQGADQPFMLCLELSDPDFGDQHKIVDYIGVNHRAVKLITGVTSADLNAMQYPLTAKYFCAYPYGHGFGVDVGYIDAAGLFAGIMADISSRFSGFDKSPLKTAILWAYADNVYYVAVRSAQEVKAMTDTLHNVVVKPVLSAFDNPKIVYIEGTKKANLGEK